MSDDESSMDLLQRWKDGDELAANELFERYVNRLIALARSRLSNKMKRRVEPEDVVQSVYRSFFRKAADGQFTLDDRGDLWKLLATITVLKVRGKVEFHTAQKRRIYAEESTDANKNEFRLSPEAIASEPTPSDAVALVEELNEVMGSLDKTQRQILELALQNNSEEEIATAVQRSGRTVRRTLQHVRDLLESRMALEE